MKLGVISGWESNQSFERAKNIGFKGVEFCVNFNRDDKRFLECSEDIRAELEKRGLETFSVGRWGMDRIDENGKMIAEAIEGDMRLVSAAAKLGSPVFNMGINYTEKLSYEDNIAVALEYIEKINNFAKDKNVKVALFNCAWKNFLVSPKEWELIFRELGDVGIKYDPSHAVKRANSYDTYLQEMVDWTEKFYHFHAKGTLFVNGVHYDDPPCGMDGINWGPVFDILITKGYKGNVSYEPHSQYWTGSKGMWAIEFSKKFLDKFFIPEDYCSEESDTAYSI